ncbi:hypothetical protein LZ575_04625 [Antarcticibacterium sp. 1MA-6-2]|uniref:hypothetical protein n=1 Tax=Antarcticibacterium sp. 1MA-6-2 TaxID=2908210 RepID=UPI001F2CC4C1|nr:hypothetical protein [Antarcticibacterium sp. 1MA-6-2]UJH91931.1 hypothetical protein LZ575_04625 [Antarcticibacterium sp. 1MA-6-2]
MTLISQKIIYSLWKDFGLEFSDSTMIFEVNGKITQSIEKIGGKSETVRDKEIRLDIISLPFNVFLNSNDYLKRSVVDLKKDTLIINSPNLPLSLIQNQTYINFQQENDNYFFSNAITFSKFIDFLEDQDQDQEAAFHFVDSVNTASRRMVFTSPTEKGRVVIEYNNKIPPLNTTIDYNKTLQKFEYCFLDQLGHLPKFLKSALIEQASRTSKDERIVKLFLNLDNVIETAYLNFEIYLNNLSIDHIRRDYDEFKSKYFKEVSEILKNVTQKIIGLPLVVASTLFAMDRIKANDAFLIVLLIIIVITSAYLTVLLRINFKDLKYVSILSDKDYDELKRNKFFIKYPEELNTFQSIKQRISSRIENLKIICESYFWILNIINTLLVSFILFYIGIPKKITLIIGLIILFIIAFARNWILNSAEEEKL